ncbi:glycosyhydrolase [Arachidicoccus ginsenosidimutans]|uniref:glycosyl hydrolase 115 family protein n=1 Tax=Arachidicoccus sp. BS20 TaxID=1850526 RepID=UPI0007F13729|nr:glycosyl hydrolase 115 family protein [Arachidicoccus sp. BS20]ANI88788.1 glycosyhydrolase [Arachidicoccus sp. BS20]
MRKKGIICFAIFYFLFAKAHAQIFVSEQKSATDFAIVSQHQDAHIYIDEGDNWLVHKAGELLQQDIQSLTGKKLMLLHDSIDTNKNFIIIGTLDHSSFIKDLIRSGKISIASVQNKWDAYAIQTVQLNAHSKGIIIVGSNKRGAAYGTFELSKQIGVSPWYWWADVPVKKKKEIFVRQNISIADSPRVKYRGIFINDEAPAFSGWVKEKFGGANHLAYEKIFELLLRLKANYLWPAMWGNAFNDDDTLNPVLANKWGIVMGTSHHEPMMRAQQEWKRYGKGAWDYTTNEAELNAFWKKGIENMDHHESVVTIGMRGDGDKPMTQGTAIGLLEKIVKNQRKIISDVTGKPASETPQDWALYKEVQDYYDQGMRVPDDVTLLLCDDNWGNIRRLPKITDKPRSGGYGIYYHFDYVGGPRNYKWINTNNIARVWEQMHLAYEYGVKNIWVVNVGDLKPMEFPISFWCDYAWNPEKINEDNLPDYYKHWASAQFGKTYADEIGSILKRYSQYASRRKPELLDANTYSIENYDEWKNVLQQWTVLLADAGKINEALPAEYKDAYFELVLHPVKAMENLHELYYDVAMNKLLASHNDIAANDYADKAKQAFINDSLISLQYNRLNNGKWNHMMDQTHIGYRSWQEPRRNSMPEVEYISNDSVSHTWTNDPGKIKVKLHANASKNSFYQKNNFISIEASHYTKAINTKNIQWKMIKDIGRDGGGITTFPVTKSLETLAASNPQLQYEIYTTDTGDVKLNAYFSPTLNFHNDSTGLQYAVSIDDEQPQIVSLNKDDNKDRVWGRWAANNIIIKTTRHRLSTSGRHIVKYWMISNAVVLQKIVLNFGNGKYSYLGAPETLYKKK